MSLQYLAFKKLIETHTGVQLLQLAHRNPKQIEFLLPRKFVLEYIKQWNLETRLPDDEIFNALSGSYKRLLVSDALFLTVLNIVSERYDFPTLGNENLYRMMMLYSQDDMVYMFQSLESTTELVAPFGDVNLDHSNLMSKPVIRDGPLDEISFFLEFSPMNDPEKQYVNRMVIDFYYNLDQNSYEKLKEEPSEQITIDENDEKAYPTILYLESDVPDFVEFIEKTGIYPGSIALRRFPSIIEDGGSALVLFKVSIGRLKITRVETILDILKYLLVNHGVYFY